MGFSFLNCIIGFYTGTLLIIINDVIFLDGFDDIYNLLKYNLTQYVNTMFSFSKINIF